MEKHVSSQLPNESPCPDVNRAQAQNGGDSRLPDHLNKKQPTDQIQCADAVFVSVSRGHLNDRSDAVVVKPESYEKQEKMFVFSNFKKRGRESLDDA